MPPRQPRDDDTRPRIGLKIKRARELKRWSQKRLGEEIGQLAEDHRPVSQKTIDNWENDRTYPRASIGAIEHVLGIRLNGAEPEPDPFAHIRRAIENDESLTRGERQALIEAHDKAVKALRAEGVTSPGAASRGRAAGRAKAQP